MTEILFQLANLWIMPFWLLIIVLPHWRWTKRVMAWPWMVAVLALAYTVLVLPQALALLPTLSNPTLAGIASLLGTPQAAAIGWIHFLAFDLFVGRWIYLDSRAQAISAWIVAPCLLLTLMFGPVGFLLYLVVRRLLRGTAPLTSVA